VPAFPDGLRSMERAAWALAGLLWFFWLGAEDGSADGPLLVAAAACLALGLTLLRRWRSRRGGADIGAAVAYGLFGRRLDPRAVWLAQSSVCGFGSGLAVGPLAALLMLVKVSLHGHPAPDFSGGEIAGVLMRTPAWALAGLCLGASLGLATVAWIGRAGSGVWGERVQSPPGEER